MAEFKDNWVNMVLLSVLVFTLFAFTLGLNTENPTNNSLVDDSLFNATYFNLNKSLIETQTKAQLQKTNFESESPTAGFGSLILFTIVSAGKVFNGVMLSVFNILIKFPSTVLGIPPVITGILTAILLVLIVLGLWKLYKLGG